MTFSRPLSQALLLGLVAAMASLYLVTLHHPLQELALTGAALALIGLSLLLERLAPGRADWAHSQGDTAGDITSFILIFGLLDSALKWLSPFLLLAILPSTQWLAHWPLALQILCVTLIIELGSWLSHYAHHRFPRLWTLHAMHHSTERLYTLNNFRFHPFNHVLNYAIAYLPALALGFAPEALLGYVALSLPVLLLQHSNLRFDFGRLDGFFNTNTLHRWHHSTKLSEGHKNFGRSIVLWDRLFGTYYNPASQGPAQVGLHASDTSYPKPRQFLRQLAYPFSRTCCT